MVDVAASQTWRGKILGFGRSTRTSGRPVRRCECGSTPVLSWARQGRAAGAAPNACVRKASSLGVVGTSDCTASSSSQPECRRGLFHHWRTGVFRRTRATPQPADDETQLPTGLGMRGTTCDLMPAREHRRRYYPDVTRARSQHRATPTPDRAMSGAPSSPGSPLAPAATPPTC